MTLAENTITEAVRCACAYTRTDRDARCLGIYLEGPFLSDAKKGAQAADNLHAPDIEMFHRLNEASGNTVRLLGVAPEQPGAPALIREASRTCAVSVAHTAADYATAMRGYQSGATHTTHLFNGMNPLHHREPGVVGAAFDSHASAELICDGIHIHPAVVRMAFRLFGEKLVLVSDSVRCAGMPEGRVYPRRADLHRQGRQGDPAKRHHRRLLHPSAHGRAKRDRVRHRPNRRRAGRDLSPRQGDRHGWGGRRPDARAPGGYAFAGPGLWPCNDNHQRKGCFP